MPKRIAAQVRWDDARAAYVVWNGGTPVVPEILLGSTGWAAWLERTSSFAFQHANGAACTVRKEMVQRGGAYWYAYRRVGERMAKRYLGRAADLTAARLEEANWGLRETQGEHVGRDESNQVAQNQGNQVAQNQGNHKGLPLHTRPQDGNGIHDDAVGAQHAAPLSPRDPPSPEIPTPPLLMTKLHVPRTMRLVERPHMMQRMQRGLARPLTLVTAPAGYGKTTALSAWVATLASPMAWVSLDAGDDDPAQFWAYVLAALNNLLPGMMDGALALLHARQALSGAALVRALLNAVAAQSEDVILILDDYHLITDPAIHAAVGQLLEHPPAQLHLFLATRGTPSLPLARLRAYDRVNEIRADDLRLRPDEVATFLAEVLELHLDPEDVVTLAERTDGWITGVQLAGLAMQGQADPAQAMAAFRGNHRHVVTYFGEEVLAAQLPEAQNFLLRTAMLDRMCGSLCDAVTGGSDGQARLAQLHAANIFLVPLDDIGEWYRYDHLFADLLRHRLNEVAPEEIPELHGRAAQWLADAGWLVEAVQHWCAAGDYDAAAQVIERTARGLLMRGEVVTLLRLLDAMPDDMRAQHPHVRLFEIEACFYRGQLDLVKRGLADIERWLAAHDRRDVVIVGGVAVINATLCAMRGAAAEVIEHVQTALALLPPDERVLRTGVLVPLGIAQHLQGHLQEADATLMDAAEASLAIGNRATAVLAMNLRAGGMIQFGRWQEAEQLCLRIIQLAEESGGILLSDIYAMLSELHYAKNDLVAARLTAEKAIALGEQWVTVDGQIDGGLRLAMVLQAQGQSAAAHEMMQQAEQWLQESIQKDAGFPWLPPLVAGMSARLALLQGRLDDARRWAETYAQTTDATMGPMMNHYYEFETLTRVRVLLAQSDLAQAEAVLTQLRPVAEAEERLSSSIEIDLLWALVAQAQGAFEQALDFLAQAVTTAHLVGYVRGFVDEGTPMRALLARLRERQRRGSMLRRACDTLLTAFDSSSPVVAPMRATAQPVEALSEREREVLHLLAQGRSNQEIARHLVVAVSTVKTHLHHIFAKLQTTDRLRAVTRARELGLLA